MSKVLLSAAVLLLLSSGYTASVEAATVAKRTPVQTTYVPKCPPRTLPSNN